MRDMAPGFSTGKFPAAEDEALRYRCISQHLAGNNPQGRLRYYRDETLPSRPPCVYKIALNTLIKSPQGGVPAVN